MSSIFESREPNIVGNESLRIPQSEGWQSIYNHYLSAEHSTREVSVILPVGCGKSGLITISPFAVRSRRTLVIAPNLNIAQQLHKDFDPGYPGMFYLKCHVLDGQPYPEPAEIRGDSSNMGDLEEADVVVTNIQQLQRENNRWLASLSSDFFDSIIFDEAHHNVAESWQILRNKFPQAKIVNFSATPKRADGQIMSGTIIYSFPIVRAITLGYVKRLKAIVLNPRTLRYVRREDGQEVEVTLDEVKSLGETDADFRRSIVTSQETLFTIVDASIRAMQRIREASGNDRHKIIASALNFQHCIQVVEAYRDKGLRADFVHSNQDGRDNQRVLEKLRNHELDVIVQVRKLGEGFDHPYLSVAAVFSVFRELSPFVQFVGRVMRTVDQNSSLSANNQGIVVFHAGSNIARLWDDFQNFSQADQDFFDQMLPMEELDFANHNEIEIDPLDITRDSRANTIEIQRQENIMIEEIPLLPVEETIALWKANGVTLDDIISAYELQPVPTTRQRERQASRKALDDLVKNKVAQILQSRGINQYGHDLDRNHLDKSNFVIVKSAVDRKINEFVGKGIGERHDFTRQELDAIRDNLSSLMERAMEEVL